MTSTSLSLRMDLTMSSAGNPNPPCHFTLILTLTLRRLQASPLTLLNDMKADSRFCNCLSALSEYKFGFPILQTRCRKIFVPVGWA